MEFNLDLSIPWLSNQGARLGPFLHAYTYYYNIPSTKLLHLHALLYKLSSLCLMYSNKPQITLMITPLNINCVQLSKMLTQTKRGKKPGNPD